MHKAAGVGSEVTQEIAMSVKGDKVTCSINGTEVASYPKADLVARGQAQSPPTASTASASRTTPKDT